MSILLLFILLILSQPATDWTTADQIDNQSDIISLGRWVKTANKSCQPAVPSPAPPPVKNRDIKLRSFGPWETERGSNIIRQIWWWLIIYGLIILPNILRWNHPPSTPSLAEPGNTALPHPLLARDIFRFSLPRYSRWGRNGGDVEMWELR